jgi:PIN domain nuclease of toxin-antitoxin system
VRLLLDTHVFLWWIADAPQLPLYVRGLIADGRNELFFSAASCWEIAIKAKLGKISLPVGPDLFIVDQMTVNAVQSLPVTAAHALHVFHLPGHHRDPFDRILVAQSQLEGLPIVTSDPFISKYKIKTVWTNK